jgi:hypothetical protein
LRGRGTTYAPPPFWGHAINVFYAQLFSKEGPALKFD